MTLLLFHLLADPTLMSVDVSTDAFDASVTGSFGSIRNPGLEEAYIDGVSFTRGAAGSRQHIWSFAAALYETDKNINILSIFCLFM